MRLPIHDPRNQIRPTFGLIFKSLVSDLPETGVGAGEGGPRRIGFNAVTAARPVSKEVSYV